MRKCHARERLNQLQQQVLLRDLGIEWQLLGCCVRVFAAAGAKAVRRLLAIRR